jgi:hypothetical protein
MNESAVSESVGVILIVAVTVILAAIIAAYSLGIVGDIHTSKNILLTVEKPTISTVTVMYRGGQDQKELQSLRIIWPEDPPDVYENPKVGDIYPKTGTRAITPGGSQNNIVVVGNFTDNAEQVLINTYV